VTAAQSPGRARPTRADEVAELRRRLDEQTALVASLQRCVTDLHTEVAELRSLVIRSQCEVIRRLSELRPAPWAADHAPPEAAPGVAAGVAPGVAPNGAAGDGDDTGDRPVAAEPALDPAEYARLVDRTRALVRTVVPAGAVLAVVTRGDDRLVDIDGRVGWHFPRTADGRWAGHHPPDSAAAVAALEDLRRRGARYLVFPATARWWLDYYGGLRQHLDGGARLVVDRPDTCTVYALDR
jgi:hypothetical protein